MSSRIQIGMLFITLDNYGMSVEDIDELIKIEQRLRKWNTDECNGDIQRCEETGKVKNRHGKIVPDIESRLKLRATEILDNHNAEANRGRSLLPFFQGDPRGCALYLISQLRMLPNVAWPPSDAEMARNYHTWGIPVSCS